MRWAKELDAGCLLTRLSAYAIWDLACWRLNQTRTQMAFTREWEHAGLGRVFPRLRDSHVNCRFWFMRLTKRPNESRPGSLRLRFPSPPAVECDNRRSVASRSRTIRVSISAAVCADYGHGRGRRTLAILCAIHHRCGGRRLVVNR